MIFAMLLCSVWHIFVWRVHSMLLFFLQCFIQNAWFEHFLLLRIFILWWASCFRLRFVIWISNIYWRHLNIIIFYLSYKIFFHIAFSTISNIKIFELSLGNIVFFWTLFDLIWYIFRNTCSEVWRYTKVSKSTLLSHFLYLFSILFPKFYRHRNMEMSKL